MFDIHCHILFGLDDGARDFEQSCTMLKLAYEQGITDIIATPHFMPGRRNASPETIRNVTKQLQDYIDEQGYGMRLYTGNEIYYHAEVRSWIEQGKVLTLADTSFVLVEFAPLDDFRYIHNSLAELLSEGYTPILAHAERYEAIIQSPKDRAEQLKRMGVMIQINASSLERKHALEKKTIKELLKNELVDFIGTDAHGTHSRTPIIAPCVKLLKRKCSKEYAQKLLYENAQRLFNAK